MLNIQTRQNGEYVILDLEGDVIMGGGSAKLRQTIAELIESNKTKVLLNFQKVRYLDSSGTGELLSASQSFNEIAGSLRLINLTPKVEQVLSLSSILPIFDIYDDEVSAVRDQG